MANYGFYGPNYSNPYQTMYQQPVMPQQMAQPQMMQPQIQTVPAMQGQAQAAPMQNQNSIIWVNSEMEVISFPVAPNAAVTLWNAKEPVVYLKKADATGKPSLTIYDLVERTETASSATQKQEAKLPNYATKDDVATLAGAVKNILSDLDSVKSDLYGLSGKRKTSKKVEPETED